MGCIQSKWLENKATQTETAQTDETLSQMADKTTQTKRLKMFKKIRPLTIYTDIDFSATRALQHVQEERKKEQNC